MPNAQEKPRRTHLDRWIVARKLSNAEVLGEMTKAAQIRGLTDHIPAPSTLNDFRSARAFPSTISTLLIRDATSGAVDLEHWADDVVRLGKRQR